MNLTLMTKMLI